MSSITDTYRKAATAIFAQFRAAMEAPYNTVGDPGYWRLGTSFDSMTDYLWMLKQSTNAEDKKVYDAYKTYLGQQLQETDWTKRTDPYAQYLKNMIKPNSSSCAYDDFCWWGIAFSKSLPGSPYYTLFIDLFGQNLTTIFQNTSTAIWQLVFNGDYSKVVKHTPAEYPGYGAFETDFNERHIYHGGSPNAWERVTTDTPAGVKAAFDGSPSSQIAVKPLFEGGLWQYDYYYNPTAGNGNFPDACAQNGNPREAVNNHYIGPYQLSLMNGLGLIYSTRLHSWTGEAKGGPYITAADTINTFLYQWFQLPQQSGFNLLWQYDKDLNKAVLRERVGKYNDGTVVPGYMMAKDPNGVRVWCGDQGLMLAGLSEYQATKGVLDPLNIAAKLLNGVLDATGPLFTDVDSRESFKNLQSYSPASDGTDWYEQIFRDPDYWSGSGIFWRYVFQSYRDGNTQIQQIIKNHLAAPGNVIALSANAAVAAASPVTTEPPVLKGPDLPWSNTPWGDESPLFKWFNSLATLTAAIYILESPQE